MRLEWLAYLAFPNAHVELTIYLFIYFFFSFKHDLKKTTKITSRMQFHQFQTQIMLEQLIQLLSKEEQSNRLDYY